MFERFTDRARRVLVLAQEEARLLNHNFIGTEHLLLGLVDEADGVAATRVALGGCAVGASSAAAGSGARPAVAADASNARRRMPVQPRKPLQRMPLQRSKTARAWSPKNSHKDGFGRCLPSGKM